MDMNTFDINNPAPTPPVSVKVSDATDTEQAAYLEDLAQPNGALWHSPLDRSRLMYIALRLREMAKGQTS